MYKGFLARARTLILSEDLEGAARELERVDENASAEVMQEKFQVSIIISKEQEEAEI